MGNLLLIWYLPIGSHFDPPRVGSKSEQKNKPPKKRQKMTKYRKMYQKWVILGLGLWPGFAPKSDIISESAHLGCPVAPKWSPRGQTCQKCLPWDPKWCQKWQKNTDNAPKLTPRTLTNDAIFGARILQPAARGGSKSQLTTSTNQWYVYACLVQSLAPKGTVAGTALAHWIYNI